MKLKNYLLILVALFISQSQAQWSVIDSISRGNFQSIHFINADTGFTFHEFGTLRRTVDGGQAWDSVPVPFSGFIFDFAFSTSNVGYAVGGAWFPFGNYYGNSIMKTVDAGITWDSVLATRNFGLFKSIATPAPDQFFAANESVLVHSANGGTTIDTVSVSAIAGEQYHKVLFTNATTAYLLASEYLSGQASIFHFYKSADAGLTWQNIYTDTLQRGFVYQDFATGPSGELLLVGAKGSITYSTNGGQTWQKQNLMDTSMVLTRLKTRDGRLYAIGSGAASQNSSIYESIDQGLTWQLQIALPTSFDSFLDMSFPTAGTGYAVTYNMVYKNNKLISLRERTSHGFELFPNPATDRVSLELAEAGAEVILVYNSLGQRVASFSADGTSQFDLDISALRPGLYTLEVRQGGAKLFKKLLKQ